MMFSQNFINKVLAAHNIVDWVQQHTELKSRGGSEYMGLCPLLGHKENTPSFSVSAEKQVYYCFGCGQSGNLLTFYQAMEGVPFAEAVERLAHKAGLPLPQHEGGSRSNKKQQHMWDMNAFAADFYATQLKQLKSSHRVKQYCQQRRLTLQLCDYFQIGYAPAFDNPLCQALKKNNASLELALQLGLVKCRKKEAKSATNLAPKSQANPSLASPSINTSAVKPRWADCYDTYRDRLMFPIRARGRNCVGFGGRIFDDAGSKGGPKYLNSRESEIFSKRSTLYGWHEASKFIRKARVSVVVEGYMDLLALFGQGITNVVATLGTSLTYLHARQLAQLAKQVVVVFDGDTAGQLAAQRSLPILLAAGLRARAVFLPSHMDPDDYVQHHGVQSLLKKLRAAPALFNLILDKSLQGFQHRADEVVQILDTLGPIVQQTKDPRLRELYIQQLATSLGQKEQWVQKHIRNYKVKEPPPESDMPSAARHEVAQAERPTVSLHNAPPVELQLLQLVLSDARHLKNLEPDFAALLHSPGVRQLIELAGQQLQTSSKNKASGADDQASSEVFYPPQFLSQLTSLVQPLSSLTPILNKELGKSPESVQSKGDGSRRPQNELSATSKGGDTSRPRQLYRPSSPTAAVLEQSYEVQAHTLADCVQRIRRAHQERQISLDISGLKGSSLEQVEVERKLKDLMQRLQNKHRKRGPHDPPGASLQEKLI